MASKGIDNIFLHYGVRREDMALIEQACKESDISEEWLREWVLKPYNEERNNGQSIVEEKKIVKIIKTALKKGLKEI